MIEIDHRFILRRIVLSGTRGHECDYQWSRKLAMTLSCVSHHKTNKKKYRLYNGHLIHFSISIPLHSGSSDILYGLILGGSRLSLAI